ncbi:MAG: S1C family serine protease [Alphaproteobacteria bacterium]
MSPRRNSAIAGALVALLAWLPAAAQVNVDDRLNAVVAIEAEIPSDARTARTLGTERAGNGVVIADGELVLTIGYLVLEAYSVLLRTNDGRALPAEILGYDYDTGFGLLRPAAPLKLTPIPFGRSADVAEGAPVLIVGSGGAAQAIAGQVTSRREFAGYWEYLLDNALYASPPHPNWGGTALLDGDGALIGIGSLFVPDARHGGRPLPGNMFVPIDLALPLIDEVRRTGKLTPKRARPWLGMYSVESRGRVVVARVAEGGPAAKAGIAAGDVVTAVAGARVASIADMYRRIWSLGQPGAAVPLSLARDGATRQLTVRSGDRYDYLKLDPTF